METSLEGTERVGNNGAQPVRAQVEGAPFEVVTLSWPRPIQRRGARWSSEPEWGAPLMAELPRPRWVSHDGVSFFTIFFREFFGAEVKAYYSGGEMRNFHVVFRVRIARSGQLSVRSSGPCRIKRGDKLVLKHDAGRLGGAVLHVEAFDLLEIAVCQLGGDWDFGVSLAESQSPRFATPEALVERYLPKVRNRLASPNGPALKFYTHGQSPLRAILSVYSLVLNGYAPSRVLVYGEDQWQPRARELFALAFPFAQVVSAADVVRKLREYGGLELCQAARAWYVMKSCVAHVLAPADYSTLDDDVFILGAMDDALAAFSKADLVYMADADWGFKYVEIWGFMPGGRSPLKTGNLNGGLYFARGFADPRAVARFMLGAKPESMQPYEWDQGFVATLFRDTRAVALPGERYLMPLWDGLPGGPAGYDYARNPCGFTAVHYAALENKPDDELSLALAPGILWRH